MRPILTPLRWLSLCCLALSVTPAGVAAAEPHAPEVRAVLFYTPHCPQCGDLFAYYLPPLLEHYGTRLAIAGIDVEQPAGAAVYQAAAKRYSLPGKWNGTPAVVVAGRVAAGPDAIAATLGDEFEALARNPAAAQWPSLPGLAEMLPAAQRLILARVSKEAAPALPGAEAPARSADRDRIANRLAIAVLAGMVLALVHSLVRLRRSGGAPRGGAWWIALTIAVGLGISAYTAYTSLAGVAPVCGPIGSCDTVQNSEYAKLFGIPMGVLGLLGYGAVLVTWLAGRRLSAAGGGWRWLPWGIAVLGVLFSLRLTYLEPFVIGHTCMWCLGSAVSMTATLWLLSGETR